MNTHAPPAPATRHARTILPVPVHEQLAHLSVDLGMTIGDLLAEGVLLLLRYHGRAEGLAEPTPPRTTGTGGAQ